MFETNEPQFEPVPANGIRFYCKVRGQGPALLMIPSIGGDCGPLEVVAEKLSDQFQVVTYDQRCHSRSSYLENWHRTSMAEQADDAAALLKALGIKSATIFGTGVGGLIGLEMMQNYPKLVRKAILHDPLVYAALENGPYKDIAWDVANLLRSTFFIQGHQAALIALMRWEYGAEAMTFTRGGLIPRITNNSDNFVMVDFPAYMYYKPDLAKLAAIKTPAKVLFSTNTPPWRREMCNWVGEHIRASVEPFLGEHAPYFLHPVETADALRLHLEK